MRRVGVFLLIGACGVPAFELIPWEVGQWTSYADAGGEVGFSAALLELPEGSDGLWLQIEIELPETGHVVVQIALKEEGAEFIQRDVAEHIEEPAEAEEFLGDFRSLFTYYENFGGDIRLGVDSPELGDRVVLTVEPEILREFVEVFAELGEAFEPTTSEPVEFEDEVEVRVPAGTFTCRKIASGSGAAWYAEEVPLFGIVRLGFPDEYGDEDVIVELTDFGLTGAADSLAGWPDPLPLETFIEFLKTGQEYEPYTDEETLGNKKPRG
ncbi:hypothetical protein KAU45_07820 [bacterium]|nr:hypothetical protein [bacterium]